MRLALQSTARLRAQVSLPPAVITAAAGAIAGGAAAILVTHRAWDRWVLAAVIGGSLVVVATRRPRTAVAVALLCLPLLALLRRLLIPQAAWTSHDPLLAIGPGLALLVLASLWIRERRPIAPDFLSKLVLVLLSLTLLQTLNPKGSGVAAALGGLVFVAAPLLWFFAGRELADRRLVFVLASGTALLAVGIGVYGLWQAQLSMPHWDQNWLAVAGYNSLYVHHGNEFTIRPFGTFSSAAEYASYLGMAIAIAVAFVLHRNGRPALVLPVLMVALVFASARTILVLTVLALLVMSALRTRRPRVALSVLAGGLALALVTLQMAGPALSSATAKLHSPLLSHMADGLAHPLDPNRSTLALHMQLFWDGIRDSIQHPLGFGTAATNIASDKLGPGDATRATEVDISNAFVSLGIPGGVLFILIIATVFQRTIAAYRADRDPLLLAVVGVLVVMLGQWLNGGYYAASPLIWFLAGYASAERERQCSAAPDQRTPVGVEARA